MAVSYKRLEKLLIDKGISKTELRRICGISSATLAKIRKSQYISLETIEKICKALNCAIEDIVEIR